MPCKRRPPCSATPTWPAWPRAKRPARCRRCSAGCRNSSAREMRVRATVRTLLAYPLLLSGVSSMVVIGLVTFVLPKFVDIFGAVRSRSAGDHASDRGDVRCVAETLVDLGAALDLRGGGAASCRGTWTAGRRKWDYAMLNTADSARHHAGVLHRPHVSLVGTDDRKRRAACWKVCG